MIWDAATGALQHTLAGGFAKEGQWVSALAFAPDSQTLAIGTATTGDLSNNGKSAGQLTFVPLQSLAAK